MWRHVSISATEFSVFLPQQYSEKEDKYEEEIKVLTDKLKEVRSRRSSLIILSSQSRTIFPHFFTSLKTKTIQMCVYFYGSIIYVFFFV